MCSTQRNSQRCGESSGGEDTGNGRLRAELLRITDLYKVNKVKVIDLEQKELHHQKAMGKVMEESARIENTTKMELRRMRVVVQNAKVNQMKVVPYSSFAEGGFKQQPCRR